MTAIIGTVRLCTGKVIRPTVSHLLAGAIDIQIGKLVNIVYGLSSEIFPFISSRNPDPVSQENIIHRNLLNYGNCHTTTARCSLVPRK